MPRRLTLANLRTGGTNSQGGLNSSQCTLEIIKGLDISGPLLWVAAVTGEQLRDVNIHVSTRGERPVIFYRIRLREARITNISTVGNGGFVERVTLRAQSVELEFVTQQADGSSGPTRSSSFTC